ncbi:MAG: hypothetical protein IJA72_03265 [Clostridia bacterium]|nr:hypothetical protein [Clostridia bacterium]
MNRLFYEFHDWLVKKYYESLGYDDDNPVLYGIAKAYKECMEQMNKMLKEETERYRKQT